MMLMKQVIERQVADIRSMVPGLEEIDLDDHQSMGLSAMHYAAWYNNHKAVQTLIEWGQGKKINLSKPFNNGAALFCR